MKLLLSTLGALTITGSSAAVLLNSTNNLVSTQQNIAVEEFTSPGTLSNSSQTIEEYLKDNQNNTLKEDILNSLFFSNEKIEVNVSILDQYKTNSPLYLILTGDELKDKLLEMYQDGLLIYNQETKTFSFIEDEISTFSSYMWRNTHWYWFGWWQLCFSHQACKDISALLSVGSTAVDIAALIYQWAPPLAALAQVISLFLTLNSTILSICDYAGNGAWIGFWGIVPDIGWGPL